MAVTMTRDQMLAALAEAAQRVPDGAEGLTAVEVSEALSIHIEKARDAIRALIQQGHAKPVKVRRMAMDGRNSLVSGYQFIAKPVKAKA